MNQTRFKGILLALGACCIWGLIFVIPQFMTGFSPMEIALGRYLFYGITSSLFLLKGVIKGGCRYSHSIWRKALRVSLVSTIGYYTFVVLALRYSSPAICALILGVSPIAIAFYGNFKQKEVSFRSLLVPSFLILIGLVIINAPQLKASESPTFFLLGLLFSLLALISWSWYVVANSRFLRHHTQVLPNDWTTLVGVTSLLWVLLFGVILGIFFSDQLHVHKYFIWNHELKKFLMGSVVLGLVCSWVGAYLWNQASLSLPVSLAGQLTVFETIFGVSYIYIACQCFPTMTESIGIIILLTSVIYGIRKFREQKSHVSQIISE